MEKFTITVSTLHGFEEILTNEIKELGGENITQGNRAVYFDGDLEMIYRANYRLRTALRVFRQIHSFRFNDADDFFLQCIRVGWESYMNINQSFAIQSVVHHSRDFKNSMYASLKVKDAIVDRFRQRTGQRPNVDTKTPDMIFHVHISNDFCTLSIDSSGDSLHKRGYRKASGDAALSEVLAAGMILFTGWDGSTDFIDPMCGSGTLSVEAALIARNIPPGKYRREFAFMAWKDFDETLYEKIKEEAVLKDFNYKIYASDILRKNVLEAQLNARSARVFNLIEFHVKDFANLKIKSNEAVMILNPPYGERLNATNLENLYQMIGSKLKHEFTGITAWILSASDTLFNAIGLKPAKKIKLLNGALVCSYQKYEIFEGKRKEAIKRKVLKINRTTQ